MSARLPAHGETARVTLGESGPRGRGEHVDLPAFGSDPRRAAGVPGTLRKRIDRFSAVAYLAVAHALSAIPAPQRPQRDRIGVFLANTRAGWSYGEPELGLLVHHGAEAMHAYQATAWFPAAAQGEVTIDLDLRGCAKTTAGRASGFGEALWLARDGLERGAIDLAVVGAAESLVNGFVLRDWPAHEPLPSDGPAEGAVVFALRRPAGQPSGSMLDPASRSSGSMLDPASRSSVPMLKDLRHSGRAEAQDPSWAPTLSAAARLHDAINTITTKPTAVSLGDGFWITITPRKEHP
jgi:hypothetical protein